MVDNQLDGPVLGVILDGTGYGDDGNIWGGEFLIGDFLNYQRAHISITFRPGGDKAVKEPYRIALGILTQIYGEQVKELPIKIISERNSFELDVLIKMIQKELILLLLQVWEGFLMLFQHYWVSVKQSNMKDSRY